VRLDAQGRAGADARGRTWPRRGARLGPVREAALLRDEDQYYRGHHEPVALPVYRVSPPTGRGFYLDPASGS
jgi:hypothetical protein